MFLFFFFTTSDLLIHFFFFCQAEDGIRDGHVTGVQTCALPIYLIGELPVGQGAGELQCPGHQGEDAERLAACRGWVAGCQATWPMRSSPSVALSVRHGPVTGGTAGHRDDHDHTAY